MAVKDAVTAEPVGEFKLKGIGRPLAAYNVLAAAPQVLERRMRGRCPKVQQLSSRQSLRQISSLVTA